MRLHIVLPHAQMRPHDVHCVSRCHCISLIVTATAAPRPGAHQARAIRAPTSMRQLSVKKPLSTSSKCWKRWMKSARSLSSAEREEFTPMLVSTLKSSRLGCQQLWVESARSLLSARSGTKAMTNGKEPVTVAPGTIRTAGIICTIDDMIQCCDT